MHGAAASCGHRSVQRMSEGTSTLARAGRSLTWRWRGSSVKSVFHEPFVGVWTVVALIAAAVAVVAMVLQALGILPTNPFQPPNA